MSDKGVENIRKSTSVISVDPGKTCGIVFFDPLSSIHIWRAWDYERTLDHILRVGLAELYERLVIERFNPRRRDTDSQLTMEVIGALKFIGRYCNMEIAEVNPSDKKRTLPDAKTFLNRHARDAEAIRIWDLRYGRW